MGRNVPALCNARKAMDELMSLQGQEREALSAHEVEQFRLTLVESANISGIEDANETEKVKHRRSLVSFSRSSE